MKKVIHQLSKAACILLLIPISLQAQQQDSLDVKFYTVQDTLIVNNVLYLSITNITDDTLFVPWPRTDEPDFRATITGMIYNSERISLDHYALNSASGKNYVKIGPNDSTRIRFEFNNLSNGIPDDTSLHHFVIETFPFGSYSGTVKHLKRQEGFVGNYRVISDEKQLYEVSIDSFDIKILRKSLDGSRYNYELLFDSQEEYNTFNQHIINSSGTLFTETLNGDEEVRFKVETFKAVPVFVDIKDDIQVPKDFAIEKIYPNPFNPSTNIDLNISNASNYDLYVYNNLGQIVYSDYLGSLNVGSYTFRLNLGYLSTGIYTVIISNKNNQLSIKNITLLK
jgi:hypothetical protein